MNTTREELKIQALLERVSNITTEYENKVADLRVELTVVSRERDELASQVQVSEAPASDDDN